MTLKKHIKASGYYYYWTTIYSTLTQRGVVTLWLTKKGVVFLHFLYDQDFTHSYPINLSNGRNNFTIFAVAKEIDFALDFCHGFGSAAIRISKVVILLWKKRALDLLTNFFLHFQRRERDSVFDVYSGKMHPAKCGGISLDFRHNLSLKYFDKENILEQVQIPILRRERQI